MYHMTLFPDWELCKTHGLEISDRWYEHTSADVVEDDEVNGILLSRQTWQ